MKTETFIRRSRISAPAGDVYAWHALPGALERLTPPGLVPPGVGPRAWAALEAYDFAMTRVTEHLARSQDDATDAPDRLVRMIRAFSESARRPAIEGGCPIMNTAIEADDTHPDLRDRARESMTLWHRLVGRIAKDEENRNKKKLTLRFDLPRGSYATLVVKRITRVEMGEG